MFNFLEKMLDMLTSAYTRKDIRNARKGLPLVTNIGRLFAVMAWGFEIVFGTAEKVRLWDDIDYACGAALDRYGLNLGVDREGTTDAFYRVMIKIKMISLLSGGDVNTVINAMAVLYDVEPEDIILEERFPAKIRIGVNNDIVDPEKKQAAALITRVVKRIIPAGVGMEMYFRTYRITEGTIFVVGLSETRHSGITRPTFPPAPPADPLCVYVGGGGHRRTRLQVKGVDNLDAPKEPAAAGVYVMAASHTRRKLESKGVDNIAGH